MGSSLNFRRRPAAPPRPPAKPAPLPLVSYAELARVPFTVPGVRRVLEALAQDPTFVGASAFATALGCHLMRHARVPNVAPEGAIAMWIKPQHLHQVPADRMPPARLMRGVLAELEAHTRAQGSLGSGGKPASPQPAAPAAPIQAQDPQPAAPAAPIQAQDPEPTDPRSRTMLAWDLVANGLSVADAAAKTGISERSVYRAQRRARTRTLCPCCGQVLRRGFTVDESKLR